MSDSPERVKLSKEEKDQRFQAELMPVLDPLYNFAYRLTLDEDDANDLVQETYLKAYRFFEYFEPGTNAKAWLFRILKNSFAAALTLHVLAYRTGLLVLYTGLLAAVVRLVLRRRLGLGLALLLALVLSPWLAYRALAPVYERVGATLWDVEQFTEGHDLNDYSLARRLAAWQTAAEVIRQQPLLGVGPADAYAAMMAQYAWHDYGLLPANRVMVHNQYLHYLLSSGAVGLLLWLALLLAPLMQPTQRRNPYIWHFVLALGTGMLVDSLLEMQIGYNLFVFGYGFLVVAGERQPVPAPVPGP